MGGGSKEIKRRGWREKKGVQGQKITSWEVLWSAKSGHKVGCTANSGRGDKCEVDGVVLVGFFFFFV